MTSGKSLPLVGQEIEPSLGSAAMSINGSDRSEINDFKGQSQTRRLADGRIEISVQGAPHRGRRNEPQVRSVLERAISSARGQDVRVKEPSSDEDARGIDGTVLRPGSDRQFIQIVSVPVDSDYARYVAHGSHQVVLTPDEAVDWIENAVRHKLDIAAADRRSIILVLDVRHAGLLAADDIVSAAKERFRPADFGFAEIWLVANVATHSARLA